MTAYEQLKQRFERLISIENAAAILYKDSETFMPKGAADDRTRQIMALAEVAHSLISAPDIEKLLDDAEKDKDALAPEDRRNLQLMRTEWIQRAGLPEELVSERARIEVEGQKLHTELRAGGDWSKMKDWYSNSFDVMREIARLKKDKLGAPSLYAALLGSFSPSLEESTVEREFGALEKLLPGLIAAAVERQKSMPAPLPLQGPFPREQQAELFRRVVVAMGFDLTRGRLDVVSGHPSCGGSSSDVRFTTDCDENNLLEGLYSTIHETGHALYEQNTPIEWRYQPAGKTMGMAVHESQSRIMEIQACHTIEFCRFLEKQAREIFNRPNDPALAAENLERLLNTAQPSFIRIQADELTYPAHIILRHKLEKALVEGTMEIGDLPKAWNDGIQKLLGITPASPAEGCMQDVHWPEGLIGYFPAYTLGDMGASQFFAAACAARPELKEQLAEGNFTPLREWLRDNVHSKGSLLETDALFIAATGEPLNAKYYLNHLSQRYLGKPYEPPSPKNGTGPKPA